MGTACCSSSKNNIHEELRGEIKNKQKKGQKTIQNPRASIATGDQTESTSVSLMEISR